MASQFGPLSVWSLQVLPTSAWAFSWDSGFPPIPKMCMLHELVCLCCSSPSMRVCTCARARVYVRVCARGHSAMEGHPVQGRFTPCPWSCQETLQPLLISNWNKWVRKSLSCFYSSFQIVYIGHIYFTVYYCVLGLYLEAGWCFCD